MNLVVYAYENDAEEDTECDRILICYVQKLKSKRQIIAQKIQTRVLAEITPSLFRLRAILLDASYTVLTSLKRLHCMIFIIFMDSTLRVVTALQAFNAMEKEHACRNLKTHLYVYGKHSYWKAELSRNANLRAKNHRKRSKNKSALLNFYVHLDYDNSQGSRREEKEKTRSKGEGTKN